MIEILNATELDRAQQAGALVGNILATLKEEATVGTNLLEINQRTKEMINQAGAISCYVDYAPAFGNGPFGHYICTGVNDAVLHGKPHNYKLKDGDLLTLDLALTLGGIAADAAISFIVGTPRNAEDQKLIDITEEALAAGIAAAQVDNKIGDISYAIGHVLKSAGYKVNLEFGGHGIGSTMHQEPHISNDGRPNRGFKLKPGLMLAIEPWVMADTNKLKVDSDGWTLRSVTGARTAHTEHTVAITEQGPQILTLPTR